MNLNTQKRKAHPHEKAKLFSYFFYWWTRKLLKFRNKKNFTVEDLYEPLSRDRSSSLGESLEKQWNKQRKKGLSSVKRLSLLRSIFQTFKKHLAITVILFILSDVILSISSAFFLGLLLPYFKESPKVSYGDALIHGGALVFFNLMKFTWQNHSLFQSLYVGGRIRAAVYSLVYKKALRLRIGAAGESKADMKEQMRLVLKDVEKTELIWQYSNAIWGAPLSALLIGYILYVKIGELSLIGILLFLLLSPLQVYIALQWASESNEENATSEARAQFVGELVRGARTIKTRAWERAFYGIASARRKIERSIIKRRTRLQALLGVSGLVSSRVVLYCTVAALLAAGEVVSPEKIYVLWPFYLALADLSAYSAMGVLSFADNLVGLERIQTFLQLDEISPIGPAADTGLSEVSNRLENKPANPSWSVKIDELSVRWEESSPRALEDVNLKFDQGKLYLLIEPGYDKSLLIAAIMDEVGAINGEIVINGRLSYAQRNSWLFRGSIKDNIIFGESFDQERYDRTIDVCGLRLDFDRLPRADETIVRYDDAGELDDEQKAKINLARAVYRQADILLLDDPLNAMDSYVRRNIIQKGIVEQLRGRTRILVTRRFLHIKEVDGIVLLDNNRAKYYNNYSELLSDNLEYSKLIEIERRKEDVTVNKIETLDDRVKRNIESAEKLSNADTADKCLLLKYFYLGSNLFVIFITCVLFIITQGLINLNDLYVLLFSKALETHKETTSSANLIMNSLLKFEESYSGSWNFCFYTGLVLSIGVLAFSRSWLYYKLCFRSSKRLHDKALAGLMRADVRFFDENPSECIIARLSKDMSSVDKQLPRILLEVLQIFLAYVGAIILASIICPFFLAPAILLIALGYWTRKFYLRHVNAMRSVEESTKTCMFDHFITTIEGISTIRTCKAEATLKKEFEKLQDVHMSAWYTLLTCKFAYSFFSRLLNCALISIIVFGFVIFKDSFDEGNIGLAITQMICTTAMISYASIMSGEVSHYLSSAGKLFQYARLAAESSGEATELGETRRWRGNKPSYHLASLYNWPFEGRLEYDRVSSITRGKNQTNLKNVNFVIRPREKVGIVGDPGSGKSSLIEALLRFCKISGCIKIDGINAESVVLETLRSRISYVPRDPALFSGSLRGNLDPFNEFSDDDIWQALEQVELKELISESREALDVRINAESGCSYSAAQRQLLSLARAILKKNRVIAIQEALDDVDLPTVKLIRRLCRTLFASCTVLIITRCPSSVIDCDKLIVMHNGRLVEFDHPYNLLKHRDSSLRALVIKEVGNEATFRRLHDLAEMNYKRNKR